MNPHDLTVCLHCGTQSTHRVTSLPDLTMYRNVCAQHIVLAIHEYGGSAQVSEIDVSHTKA